MNLEETIRPALVKLVTCLVEGRLDDLVPDRRIGRTTVEDLQRAIAEYPGRLTQPPESAFETLDLMRVSKAKRPQYLLHFNLWYDDQPSDLTLLVDVFEDRGMFSLAIDDLHVL